MPLARGMQPARGIQPEAKYEARREGMSKKQAPKNENKDEVESLLNEALALLHGEYDIEGIVGSLGSAIFLLEEDAGRHEGIADGIPSGG